MEIITVCHINSSKVKCMILGQELVFFFLDFDQMQGSVKHFTNKPKHQEKMSVYRIPP